MANLSLQDIHDYLVKQFGPTLAGSRDEGLDEMAEALVAQGHDRADVEAALAEMVEQGTIRYLSEPVGGVGAGVVGVLEAPTGASFAMEDGRPRHGAVPASQEHGSGYWALEG
jgi:hypothetical protein